MLDVALDPEGLLAELVAATAVVFQVVKSGEEGAVAAAARVHNHAVLEAEFLVRREEELFGFFA